MIGEPDVAFAGERGCGEGGGAVALFEGERSRREQAAREQAQQGESTGHRWDPHRVRGRHGLAVDLRGFTINRLVGFVD